MFYIKLFLDWLFNGKYFKKSIHFELNKIRHNCQKQKCDEFLILIKQYEYLNSVDIELNDKLKTATTTIRQAVEFGKYKSWNSEVGEQKAQSIMEDFHNGLYGSKNGMWVQINEAVEILEDLYCK